MGNMLSITRYQTLDWLTRRLGVALCWIVTVALIMSTVALATAEDLSILGGTVERTGESKKSFSWQLEYLEGISEHFAYSLSCLNEGHTHLHHRDGLAAQLWTRTNLFDRHLSLMAGVGPYSYCDSTWNREGTFVNNHGIGAICSLATVWYTDNRLFFKIQGNFVDLQRNANIYDPQNSTNTFSALVGIGYQFDTPRKLATLGSAQLQQEKTTNTTSNELTLFAGLTSVNSAISQSTVTYSLEYRRGLMKNLDWTVAWSKEGESYLNRGNSISTQLWATTSVLDDLLSLGIGAGAHATLDHYNVAQQSSKTVSGIASISASYRLLPYLDTRITWNRIITSNDRDTDIFLGGVGYRF